MHQGPKNITLYNEIICQINRKAEIVKLDLNFLEAPKSSGDNYVNVTQNSLSGFQSENIKSQAAVYHLLSNFQGN